MKKTEIISGILSWSIAALALFWEGVYGIANSNPHGSFEPQPVPIHLFFLPIAGVGLAVFVLYSTRKNGTLIKGLCFIILPLIVFLITILGGIVACINVGNNNG